jgi:hypothetical protein
MSEFILLPSLRPYTHSVLQVENLKIEFLTYSKMHLYTSFKSLFVIVNFAGRLEPCSVLLNP